MRYSLHIGKKFFNTWPPWPLVEFPPNERTEPNDGFAINQGFQRSHFLASFIDISLATFHL